VLQAWQPGQEVALHWIGESAGVNSDDAKHPNPVSTIGLPIDLPAGWYNLATNIQSAGGSVSSAGVIKVTESP